jgi:hypothetical protein
MSKALTRSTGMLPSEVASMCFGYVIQLYSRSAEKH